MDKENQKRMDEVYKNMSLDKIPWNIQTPPELLVQLIESGKIQPCRAIDLGCGAGNYAIYLAQIGFDVTGIDFSPTAIKIAQENANARGVKCDFIVADVVNRFSDISGTWDFVYDWGLLHHIFPEHREKYVKNVYNILNPKGKYLSLCFS
ncbi:MAG: class I SAM-dependent methyltransferase, partial [Planctomycetota bacterium]